MSDDRDITKDWITKEELAKKLGRSVTAVVRLQKAGRLHPKVDEKGVNRYSPEEVEAVLEEPRAAAERASEFAEYQLDVVKQVIDMVRIPRERIDEILFQIIERQEAQIDKLLTQKEADRALVEAAKDNTHERDVAMTIVNSEQRIKELAAGKFMQTIQTFLSKGQLNGIQLSPDQLAQLLEAGEFLTPEQEKMAKQAVLMHKQHLQAQELKAKKEAEKKELQTKPAVDVPTSENPTEVKESGT